MENDSKLHIKKGVITGLSFFVTILFLTAITAIIAQTITTFSSGDLISASKMNENFSNIKTTITDNQTLITNNHLIAAPEGTISAFYLAACPTGWVAADGSNSTPDLRGRFVRGLDDFGSGAAGRDPSGVRALGNSQEDAFQDHQHWRNANNALEMVSLPVAGGSSEGPGGLQSSNRHETGGAFNGNSNVETRPKNVALTYCMRKNV